MKAPFPYFGGKSRVADEVWARFGDIRHFVDPFCGSCALWLLRPEGMDCIATVNDKDGLLVNFWRASAHDPGGLARLCDWPVSELDLHARRTWLMKNDECIAEKLRDDPRFYDLNAAAWWVWGISQWIGGGWTKTDAKQRPHLSRSGMGIFREMNREEYFRSLKNTILPARFCCGDWTRVLGESVLFCRGDAAPAGVFLDPPYGSGDRDENLYKHDGKDIAGEAAEWARDMALKHGNLRIALCDYDGIHELPGWAKFRWKTGGGYSSKGSRGQSNSFKETIWFSPSCLEARQGDLFCSGVER